MLGIIVNVASVNIGGATGILIKKGIPERVTDIILKSIGLSLLALGLKDALTFTSGLLLIIYMVIGSIIGELIDIENKLRKTGECLEKALSRKGNSIVEGFLSATLLFCIGSMAIVGSIKSGISNDNELLYIKSLLDGVVAIILASTYGVGVLFAALSIFIYQGGIYILSLFVKAALTDVMINEISIVGGVMIAGLGINMLLNQKIKVANMLPVLLLPILFRFFQLGLYQV